MTFKYFDRALPKAIMNLYNKSLHDPKKITRSIEACSLHPKPFLKPGNMMFNIITHWNQISPSLRNEKSLKEFRAKIINIQNTAVDCVKQNCYSCNYNYQNLKNLIRYWPIGIGNYNILPVVFKSICEIQCDLSKIILPETLFTSFTTQLFYMFFLAMVNFVIDR